MNERRMLLKSTAVDMTTYQPFADYVLHRAQDNRVALINTASKAEPDQRLVDGAEKALLGLGFWPQMIDIEMYDEDELKNNLGKVVFMAGGNTYYLMKAINHYRTRIDRVIKELMDEQGLVYMGASAGSAVAGASIEMSTSENVTGLTDLRGMGLVPFSIASHYSAEKHADFKARADRMKKEPIVALTNEQAIMVDGQDFFLIGGNEPVVFNTDVNSFPRGTNNPPMSRFTLGK